MKGGVGEERSISRSGLFLTARSCLVPVQCEQTTPGFGPAERELGVHTAPDDSILSPALIDFPDYCGLDAFMTHHRQPSAVLCDENAYTPSPSLILSPSLYLSVLSI